MNIASLGIRVDSSQAKTAFADLEKMRAAGESAEKAVNSLGIASKQSANEIEKAKKAAEGNSKAVDDLVKKLQTQATVNGMTARETKLYELALRGASKAQLEAADSAIRLNEGYQKGVDIGSKVRLGFAAIAAAATAAAAATYSAASKQIEQIANYQTIGEKMGDTAVNVASLQKASDVSSVSLDSVAAASIRLTQSLSKTDDESKLVAQGIKALGLDFQTFKTKSPIEQIDAISKALSGYRDGAEKTAVVTAIFGKSASDLIPLFNDLANGAQRYTRLTEDQIKRADEFTKAHAAMRSEFETFIKVQASEALPLLTSIQQVFAGIVRDETAMATATDVLKSVLGGVVVAFQTVAIIGSDVGFVFLGVGREIGAIAAQLVALAKLDFAGFSAISEAVKEDAARARVELDKFQARVMAIGQPPEAGAKGGGSRFDEDYYRKSVKPTIDTSGLNRDKDNGAKKAAQEARAQLTFDLDEIRKAQDALKNTYSNSEKIMEAIRAANLTSEKEYYEAKREFIRLNADTEEAALQQQIARLQKENLSGKEKIDNDRKILDARAKLDKVRETAAANTDILNVQEKASTDKTTKSFIEATHAAQEYIDTLNRQYSRELDAMGAGENARNRVSGRNQIDDRYQQQLLQLESDKRRGAFDKRDDEYQKELDLIKSSRATALKEWDKYYDSRVQKESNWTIGASEALNNYRDVAANVARQTEGLFTNAFQGMEDAIVNFTMTGKLSFSDLAKSIIADMVRIQVRQNASGLFSTLGNAALSYFTGPTYNTGGASLAGSFNPTNHTGGIVGAERTSTRFVTGFPSNAPRYHTGGIAGDEVPTILRRGEGVFTQGQMRNLAPVSASGQGSVSVNVSVDASGSKVEGDEPKASQLGQMIGNAVRVVLVQEMRPGGLLTA